MKKKYDVIIVGAGVAGLNCALHLPSDKSVLVICKGKPTESDSYLAQGGICMLRGQEDFEGYFEDTMRAGHYENDPDTVRCMLENSQEQIAELVDCGVQFARDEAGNFRFTREGGHRRPRILFHEDCTGLEITTRLYSKVSALKNVRIQPYVTMLDILEHQGAAAGIVAKAGAAGEPFTIYSDYVVLATGGIGGLYKNSTNFRSLTGDGLAVCIEHGVEVEHLDYVQIHPTTLYSKKRGRRFLISESVRGEGAWLLNAKGERFTDELQPRDVVTAAILAEMKKEGSSFVRLDLRPIDREMITEHFPTIVRHCAEEGYDVFAEPIPVVPSQHYFMGGIKSDLQGKTTMPGLYAVGETCCNGVHGKNRLASNSLLESLIFAKRAALDIAENYRVLPLSAGEEAERRTNRAKYVDVKSLFQRYKKLIRRETERSKK
ncbi:MAG: L-aspartate oxidase [Clostridia bacterium]|nr:L-aspartate oxidase [Clostridia bacterium]